VSDTWSTDVLASDSEPPEQNQLDRLEEVVEEPPNLLSVHGVVVEERGHLLGLHDVRANVLSGLSCLLHCNLAVYLQLCCKFFMKQFFHKPILESSLD